MGCRYHIPQGDGNDKKTGLVLICEVVVLNYSHRRVNHTHPALQAILHVGAEHSKEQSFGPKTVSHREPSPALAHPKRELQNCKKNTPDRQRIVVRRLPRSGGPSHFRTRRLVTSPRFLGARAEVRNKRATEMLQEVYPENTVLKNTKKKTQNDLFVAKPKWHRRPMSRKQGVSQPPLRHR